MSENVVRLGIWELNPGLQITSRMPLPLGHTTMATWLYIDLIVAGSRETIQHTFSAILILISCPDSSPQSTIN